MKKIAVFLGEFPIISQTFITNHIDYLIEEGYDLTLYCSKKLNFDILSNEKSKDYLKKNTFSYGVPNNFLIKTFIAFKGLFIKGKNLSQKDKRFISQCRAHKFDIIHSHFGPVGVRVQNWIDKKIITCNQHFTSFHGYDAHKFDSTFYQKLFNSSTTTIIANTKYTANNIKSLGYKGKTEIIPEALYTKKFQPSNPKNTIPTILYVGRLIEWKGAIQLISAIHEINKSKIEFDVRIVGDGPIRSLIEEKIEHLDLKNVTLLGAISNKEVKNEMNNADVFCLPGYTTEDGRQENQGLVIQEAQAMQLPVVVTDYGGVKDGIIDGVTGYALPEKDLKSIVKHLTLLIKEEELRENMGKAGRTFVIENYDQNIVGKKLEKVYSRAS